MSMPCPKCGDEVYREDNYECTCFDTPVMNMGLVYFTLGRYLSHWEIAWQSVTIGILQSRIDATAKRLEKQGTVLEQYFAPREALKCLKPTTGEYGG